VSLSGTATDSSPYGINISGTSLSGYAWSDELGWIDMNGVTLQTPTTLKVCQDSCSSTFFRGKGGTISNFSLVQNTSQDLVACFNAVSDCSDPSGDVTSLTAWNEDVGSPIVSLSSVLGKERITAGSGAGSENITATYAGTTATMNATVVCVPTTTCSSPSAKAITDQYCPSETNIDTGLSNGCGTNVICPVGTRFCDFNWREVAP
jgi:hypothetical protein